MDDEEESFEQRAARRRRTWSGGLVERQTAVQACDSTPAERILHMALVADAAWALSGRSFPTYTRADMPCRLIRPPR